jgi:hypothetical protein
MVDLDIDEHSVDKTKLFDKRIKNKVKMELENEPPDQFRIKKKASGSWFRRKSDKNRCF